MKFAFEVGDSEKARVEFYRSPWIGTMRITVDGQHVVYVAPTCLCTHFSFKWVKRYTFVVGKAERHEITIERERPVIAGGLRPNDYRVYIDGKMTEEHHGY